MGNNTDVGGETPRRMFLRTVGAAGSIALLSQATGASDSPSVLDDALDLESDRPQEVLIVFGNDFDVDRLADLALVDGFHVFETLPIAAARLTGGQLRTVAGWDGVRRIAADREIEAYNHDSQEDTNARTVWESDELGYTGEHVEVAIIDSGLDGKHPTFSDALEANHMYVGDPFSGDVEWVDAGQANTDYLGHGTHCAGSLCGNGDMSVLDDYTGMAPGATLTSYAWPALTGTTSTAIAAYDHIVDGKQNGDNDIRLISNSWGLPEDYNPLNPVTVAAYHAFKEGILSLFAAGNSGPETGTMQETQLAPFVMSIGGTNADMSAWDTSSRGDPNGNHDRERALSNYVEFYEATFEGDSEAASADVDGPLSLDRPAIAAKGNAVMSSQSPEEPLYATGKVPTPILVPPDEEYIEEVPEHAQEYGAEPMYIPMSGTSMACPTAAGCVTLFLDAYYDIHGEFPNPVDTINTMEATGREAIDDSYNRVNVGAGYVDAKAAVETALEADGLPPGLEDGDLPPGLADGDLPPGLAARDDSLPDFDDVVLAEPHPDATDDDEE